MRCAAGPRRSGVVAVALCCAGLFAACGDADDTHSKSPVATGAPPASTRPQPPAPSAGRLPLLGVTLELEGWKKLVTQMREARERGALVRGADAWVPITLTHEGARLQARARLKGDTLAHLDLERPSLRIRLAAGDRLFGQRAFSLQAPGTRGHQAEALYLEQLRGLGVLAPRYRFVHVAFGRQHPGVMAMEEAFGKELLENQQRRASVIVRFDDSVARDADSGQADPGLPRPRPALVAFEAGRVARSPELQRDRALAVGLLRGFVEGKLAASRVFDVERLATFLAVSELWDAGSALRWQNLRFAYDPYTGRLEPVAYDAGVMTGRAAEPLLNLDASAPGLDRVLHAGWLADPALRARFFELLKAQAGRVVAGPSLEELQAREAALLAELPSGVFEAHRIAWPRFAARAALLARLDASTPAVPEAAPLADSPAGAAAELGPAPADEPAARDTPVLPEPSPAALAKQYPWLRVDTAARSVSAAAGVRSVRQTLWLPEGYALVLGPGVTLRFGKDAALVVRGGCSVRGTPAAPVTLEPSGTDWPGLVVLASGARCDIEGLVVKRTRGVSSAEWRLPGGVTFHGARLALLDSRFEGTTADAALHVVRGAARLERLKVSDAHGDGVAFDHATGSVQGLVCERVGADGLDSRGSELTLDALAVHGAGDKALSVGEASTLTVRALGVRDAALGVAVKEGSRVTLLGGSFERIAGAALLAFEKKPGYGPARLEASGLGLHAVGASHALQAGSTLLLEGRPVQANGVDLKALYGVPTPPAHAAPLPR